MFIVSELCLGLIGQFADKRLINKQININTKSSATENQETRVKTIFFNFHIC